MPDETYLSIGDVLSQLRSEFPDITISKIRFLESQGLLDPERTPSGYRKFYEADVERLRWILKQQKENFLPLKVIKERLERGETLEGVASPSGLAAPVGDSARPDMSPEPSAVSARWREAPEAAIVRGAGPGRHAGVTFAGEEPGQAGQSRAPAPSGAAADPAAEDRDEVDPLRPGGDAPGPARSRGGLDAASPRGSLGESEPAGRSAYLAPGAGLEARQRDEGASVVGGGSSSEGSQFPSGMSLVELARSSGLTTEEVIQLESFGLVSSQEFAGDVFYGADALAVARLAAAFQRFGLEARHLRLYRNAAEREAGLFEQVIIPLLKQRNPEARRRSVEALAELSRLGKEMHALLLEESLKRQAQV